MVRLRAKRAFYDRKAERYRPTGEVFDVTEARAEEILAAGVAEIVEILATPAASAGAEVQEPPKSARKRKRG